MGGFSTPAALSFSVSSGSCLSEKEVGLQFLKFCSQNERSLKAEIKLEIGLIPHQSPCAEKASGGRLLVLSAWRGSEGLGYSSRSLQGCGASRVWSQVSEPHPSAGIGLVWAAALRRHQNRDCRGFTFAVTT